MFNKQKKIQTNDKGNRLLISVNVLGSAGPIRFVVSEKDLVGAVIDTALKRYSREGRLPILGSDLDDFLLYCANSGFEALSPWDTIGTHATRNFTLCRKPNSEKSPDSSRKSTGGWKSWINKSLSFKIPSH